MTRGGSIPPLVPNQDTYNIKQPVGNQLLIDHVQYPFKEI